MATGFIYQKKRKKTMRRFFTAKRRMERAGAKLYTWIMCGMLSMLLLSCSVSYRFNGASIDYTTTKTIQIDEFPIRSSYVWGPMAAIFNNKLKDIYATGTQLEQVKRNGDLVIEGEITQYQQRNKGVSSEGHSSQIELSITVNVRFTNNVNHTQDFERQFTASSYYESSQNLNSVQEDLVNEMVKNITEQIFNATVANW